MQYVIRCSSCELHAPVAGARLTELSDQVVAFQAAHAHAAGRFTVEHAPEPVGLPEPRRAAPIAAAAAA